MKITVKNVILAVVLLEVATFYGGKFLFNTAGRAIDFELDKVEKVGRKTSEAIRDNCQDNSFIEKKTDGEYLVDSCGRATKIADDKEENKIIRKSGRPISMRTPAYKKAMNEQTKITTPPKVTEIDPITIIREEDGFRVKVHGRASRNCNKVFVVGDKNGERMFFLRSRTDNIEFSDELYTDMDSSFSYFWEDMNGKRYLIKKIAIPLPKPAKTSARPVPATAPTVRVVSAAKPQSKKTACKYPAPIVSGVDTRITEAVWIGVVCNERKWLTIFKESTFNPYATNLNGKVFGLCQIHGGYNPKEYQAVKKDPSVENQARICNKMIDEGVRFYGADKPLTKKDMESISFPGRPWS